MIRTISRIVYSLFGALFLIVGATVMLFHTGLMPEALRQFVIEFAHNDDLAIHLIQELSSLLVFTGLITFWFVRHYDQSLPFHWSMTVFWALFSFAHWFNGSEGPRSIKGPIINTIPLLVFLLIGLLRAGFEHNTAPSVRSERRGIT
ncbi:MAG TPA: hypothetical protein VKN18_05290 [Blastocatellia bacterium]|nr:hypothetical protein [Blastocatellia bacterium]